MASCSHSDLHNEPQGGSGPVSRVAFSATLEPQYTINYTSAEGEVIDLDQIQWPSTANFTLDILSGESVVQSHPGDAIPSELELYVGAYSLRAHSGVNTEAWNVPYMEGTQDFSLSSSSTAFNTRLGCELKSTLVYLVFDKNFATVFSHYTAYLNTEHTEEAWVWTADERRVAFMRPSNELLIRVDVTMRANGATYNYGINPLVDLKAGELNVVNFSMVGGEVMATISSDNGVKVSQKTVLLEPDWLATRRTSISTTFDPATALENVYGLPYTTPTDVVIRSNVGLKSLKLKASGDLPTLLGSSEVDLHGVNEVEEKTGLVFSKAEGAMAYDGRLNFKKCFNTLPVLSGTSSQYVFTIEAVDLLGETKSFDTKIDILLPELGARAIDPSKIWNRYAKISGVSVTDPRVPPQHRESFSFNYVIRQGEGGAWEPLGTYTGSGDIYKNGLKPATTYTTAIAFGGDRYLAQASFTTDREPQIPNGDFSQTALPPQANGNIATYYEPTSWATLNALTTQNYSTSAKASQSYPCVKIEDGAAVLTTIGYGANSKINHKKPWGSHSWTVKSKDQVSAGKIYLGSYVYGAADPQVLGLPFSYKPNAVRLQYKYTPHNNTTWEVEIKVISNGTVMGRGYLSGSLAVGSFTEAVVPIEYNAANFGMTPTSVELYFLNELNPNTNNLYIVGKDTPGNIISTKETSQSYYEGTKLYVDDVELVYLQDINDSYTIK